MKKHLFYLMITMALLMPGLSFAQINEGHANLNVLVSQLQSLIIDGGTPIDPHNISKKINDTSNVKIGQINQINVISLGKFVLKVSAREEFQDMEDNDVIPPSAVYVSSGAVQGSSYTASDFIFEKDVNLALNKPKDLIHAQNSGSLNNSFEIEYYASGIATDIRNSNLDGTVVYTIEVE